MNKKTSKTLIMGFVIILFVGIIFVEADSNIVNLKQGIMDLILEDGNVPVAIQDQHTEIIDLVMHKEIDNFTLNQSYIIGDRSLYIEVNSIAPVVGDVICLKEKVAFYQAEIISVTLISGTSYLIEVDTPLDYEFTSSSFGCTSTTNMAIDGSVTPVIFKVSPKYLDEDMEWDITRIIFVMSGEGVGVTNDHPDDSDFGVTGNLDNGIVLRSVNGITKNIFNVKRNGEFRLRAYDVTYTEKSKAGLYSISTRRTFSGIDKNGVTVRLNAVTSDTIEVIIQDDLTEMFGMKAVIQGHVVKK